MRNYRGMRPIFFMTALIILAASMAGFGLAETQQPGGDIAGGAATWRLAIADTDSSSSRASTMSSPRTHPSGIDSPPWWRPWSSETSRERCTW